MRIYDAININYAIVVSTFYLLVLFWSMQGCISI